MSSHPTVRLGEICRPRQWKTLSKKDLVADGFPVYGANGKIGFATEFTHSKPTLLIGCRGSCGSVHITEPFSYANGNAMALDELNEEWFEAKYLYYYFLHRGFQDVITGTSQPQIIQQHLRQVEIPLPPLEEQRRIAAILDKADQLLGQSRLLIKKVPSVEQSIFESLFGELVNGRTSYPVKALEEIVKGNRIGLVRASNECGSELPYSYLKMDSIGRNGRLLLHKATKTSASPEELADYSVRNGDVLFNTRNSRELVGKTAVYRGADEMLFNNNLMRLRFNSNTVSPDFFRLFLASRQGASELESRKSGTTSVCAIYWKNLKTMPVPLPPYELQIQLDKTLESLESLTNNYFRQEASCNVLARVLKSDLLSGNH